MGEPRGPSQRSTRRRRPGRGEGGFGLLEVVLAMGLLGFVLVGAERGAVDAMSAAAVVKQHTVATTLLSATIAQAEALPFAALQAGLDPAADPLGTDRNVRVTTSGPTTSYVLSLTGGAIAACGTTSPQPPLVPHVVTVTMGIPYRVATYPTVPSGTCGSNPAVVTVVVVVTWQLPSGATGQVVGSAGVAAP